MLKIKYNGRTFSNGRALADAMTRDLNNRVERSLRQAAAASGVSVRKTSSGYVVDGDAEKMARFNHRIGR